MCGSVGRMSELKFGPARVPSQESPEEAVELLVERGYTACEIDFEGRFWMDYDFATRLGELRARLEKKDRAVPFGVEVMGRVRDLGSAEDVVEISHRCGWVRPVLDFAHMHATSDGAFTSVEPFAGVLASADAVMPPDTPFHVHFSDIQFANRNETKHLPYGEGTLRAEPLREALARFERPATVISESPTVESTDEIKAILGA